MLDFKISTLSHKCEVKTLEGVPSEQNLKRGDNPSIYFILHPMYVLSRHKLIPPINYTHNEYQEQMVRF